MFIDRVRVRSIDRVRVRVRVRFAFCDANLAACGGDQEGLAQFFGQVSD